MPAHRSPNVLIIADFAPEFSGAFIQSLVSLSNVVVHRGGRIAYLFPTQRSWQRFLEPFGPVYLSGGFRNGRRLSVPLIQDALRICQERGINLVHTHFGLVAPLCGCALNLLRGVKHVWHHRSHPNTLSDSSRQGSKRWIAPLAYRLLDVTTSPYHVAISNDLGRSLTRAGYISCKRLRVLNNAIDLSKYNPTCPPCWDALGQRIGMALKGRPIVGMVANFGSQKDQETLIEAISRVRSIVPDVALLLVGERLVGQSDARIAQLKERIRSLGLEGNVYFAGQWENVAEVIACFDVGVLSSHWEGFGNVVVEYMAMGKPVVATRIGGIPDIIVDGETGYLVEPYHPQGMAERILQLLQDSEMRVRFGSAGRRRAEERFSVDRWAEAMYGTYLEALAGAWQ